ncbi:hypothetical protein RJ55_07044 [Drechmeria coniospora]|nr:hypothetical protein RJ55_07044 [Drechmeria coniospora]
MSPKLKPLLLPQLVEERRRIDAPAGQAHDQAPSQVQPSGPDSIDPSYVYYTANSSSSDVASPVTPTFSPRCHQRFSSSASSLELLPPAPQDGGPTSPLPFAAKAEKRQLPDVQEDPMERFEESSEPFDGLGLYRCLCDAPCDHRNSSEGIFPGDLVGDDFDIDYDLGFLSDGDLSAEPGYSTKKKRRPVDSAFAGLTSRLGSRMPTMRRWRSSKRLHANPQAELAADVGLGLGLDYALSREPSSRSSSLSAPNNPMSDHLPEAPLPPHGSSASYYDRGGADDVSRSSVVEMTAEEHSNLERDRSLATTPLLPPLLTDAVSVPPLQSPLQSPTVAPPAPPPPTTMAPPPTVPTHYPHPSLSSQPSMVSLRPVNTNGEAPPLLSSILQEHDEWSDRLGHANFTVAPLPYELDVVTADTVSKFRDDWDAARCNYTKHLVRTGEHYGQTSKIYGLTEAKWAETERRWKGIYDDLIRQNSRSAPGSTSQSRNHSRGRGRGRSSSSVGAIVRMPTHEDVLADAERRRMDDCLPSVVPRMLESLDAEGKFPGRGDEDIVGPMQRDLVMIRARSEDAKGHFWRSLADKVGFRK